MLRLLSLAYPNSSKTLCLNASVFYVLGHVCEINKLISFAPDPESSFFISVLYLIIVSIIWGFSFGLFKEHLTGLNPNLTAWIRLVMALPIFLPFYLSGKQRCPGNLSLRFLGIGAIQYGLMYACLNNSYRYLEGWEVALFTIFTPLYISILVDLHTQRINSSIWLSSLLAVLGAGIIVYRESSSPLLWVGFLWVQGANICFAYGQVAYKELREKTQTYKDHQIYALLYLGAILITTVNTSIHQAWHQLFSITHTQWLVLAYLGTIASGLCFFWWNKGAVKVSHGTLSTMNNLKIPIAIIISYLFFKESMPLLKVTIGTAIILLGLWIPLHK